MTPKARIAAAVAIVLLVTYSVLLLSRIGFVESPTLEGGYGTGLDASRQYIVDNGRIHTDRSYVSPWFFVRSDDQHLQLLNAIINIMTGYTDPSKSAYLFSVVPYPTFFLVFAVASFFTWVGRNAHVHAKGKEPTVRHLALYSLFAVFPVYTLVQPQTASYPGYLAPVYMFFLLSLLVRRAAAKRFVASYIVVIAVASFAFFNMYHSFSIELALMLALLLFMSIVSKSLRILRGPSAFLLVLYATVGVYQNIVLIAEPANLLTYLADWRAAQSFILSAQPNRAGELGNPATRLFGIAGIIVIGTLAGLFLWKNLNDLRKGTATDPPERLSFWVACSTAVPLVPLFALGGVDYVANRFRDQVFVWVLVLVLPFMLVNFRKIGWRRFVEALLVIGVACSVTGSFVALSISPQSYLTPQELRTATFVWNQVPAQEYVISDWTHASVLMYHHSYLFGPDPYKMNESLFENSTRDLFYSDDTGELAVVLRSMVGSGDYTLLLSDVMATQGPTGPTQSYVPAVATILTRFQDAPEFNVIYSTGQTVLVQPSS